MWSFQTTVLTGTHCLNVGGGSPVIWLSLVSTACRGICELRVTSTALNQGGSPAELFPNTQEGVLETVLSRYQGLSRVNPMLCPLPASGRVSLMHI